MPTISLVQLKVDACESLNERVSTAERLIGQASDETELIVLPELWQTGPFLVEQTLHLAQPLDGPFVETVSMWARERGAWIHGGSFLERDGSDVYNTAVLVSPDGDLVAHYRKIHRFGFDAGEARVLTAGRDVVCVETPLGRTALATCYDLRFPELFRAFVDAGATAVVVASGWPLVRKQAWSVMVQSRAMENQMWVVGCNQVGNQGGVELGGDTVVVSPRGDRMAEVHPSIASNVLCEATIDPDEPAGVRASFPALKDRRTGLFA